MNIRTDIDNISDETISILTEIKDDFTVYPGHSDYKTSLRIKALELAIEAVESYRVQVAYLCDRTACTPCINSDCTHTMNIGYAKNFVAVGKNRYWEKEK